MFSQNSISFVNLVCFVDRFLKISITFRLALTVPPGNAKKKRAFLYNLRKLFKIHFASLDIFVSFVSFCS